MSDQPRQSSSTKKTTGAKDAKSLKQNKNRSLDAPPMPDMSAEQAVAERLGSRGHGAHSPAVVRKVLCLAQRGYSISQIATDRKLKGVPPMRTLYDWRREDPEFREQFDAHYRDFMDDQARQMLPLAAGGGREEGQLSELLEAAKKLPSIKGLKPAQRVKAIDAMISRTIDASTALLNAQDKRVHRTLQIAARQLPAEWGEHTEGETDMIVLDVGLGGPIKTLALPGSSDGQNRAALDAMIRRTPGSQSST